MKKSFCILIALLAVLIALLPFGREAGASNPDITSKPPAGQHANEILAEPNRNGELRLTMLDVGQGLSVLIEADGKAMVYDGGNRAHSSYVVSFLKRHRISDLDYLVASHYDEDHIAGLVGILRTSSVGTAVIPPYTAYTKIYESFMSALQEAKSVVYAKAGDRYKLGNANVDILYSCNGTETTDNNMSTVIKISYGEFSAILTGDAELETEDALVYNGADLGCTLYVVGHHGSSYSSSDHFVQAMHPKLALISVGADNMYGHPAKRTLDVLESNGVTVYRTDMQGAVSVSYDGSAYRVLTERKQDSGNMFHAEDAEYVLNISSMKFHRPGCEAVGKIAGYNKRFTKKSRGILIDEGYLPCRACNP